MRIETARNAAKAELSIRRKKEKARAVYDDTDPFYVWEYTADVSEDEDGNVTTEPRFAYGFEPCKLCEKDLTFDELEVALTDMYDAEFAGLENE